MLVAVVSDTHDNMDAIRKLIDSFRRHKPDIVIHLGDIVSPFALRGLLSFPARYIIVLGNNDGDKALLREVAMKAGAVLKDQMHEFSLENLKILAIHGFGSVELTKSLVEALALSNKYDIILYGHTHRVDVRKIGKTLIVNPGECCGYLTNERTFALLNTRTLDIRIENL